MKDTASCRMEKKSGQGLTLLCLSENHDIRSPQIAFLPWQASCFFCLSCFLIFLFYDIFQIVCQLFYGFILKTKLILLLLHICFFLLCLIVFYPCVCKSCMYKIYVMIFFLSQVCCKFKQCCFIEGWLVIQLSFIEHFYILQEEYLFIISNLYL